MGVRFVESGCNVALGIDIEANKDPLALAEGSTENASLVTDRSDFWSASAAPRRCAGADFGCRAASGVSGHRVVSASSAGGSAAGLLFYADELEASITDPIEQPVLL